MEWIELKEHHQEIVLSHMHFQKDLTAALSTRARVKWRVNHLSKLPWQHL